MKTIKYHALLLFFWLLATLVTHPASAQTAANLESNKFLRLTENPGEAPDFRYDVGASLTSGKWRVTMDLLFESLENYQIYFRESGGATVSVANIFFNSSGTIDVNTAGGNASGNYSAGTVYTLEALIDLDAEIMDLTLNGNLIADDLGIDDIFGSVSIGFQFTSFDPGPGFRGAMQIDNFRVESDPSGGTALRRRQRRVFPRLDSSHDWATDGADQY